MPFDAFRKLVGDLTIGDAYYHEEIAAALNAAFPQFHVRTSRRDLGEGYGDLVAIERPLP